jgi:hypothetical protein
LGKALLRLDRIPATTQHVADIATGGQRQQRLSVSIEQKT